MDNVLSQLETDALLLSLRVASIAVLASLPIAFAFAWLLARHDFPGKTILAGVVYMPLILPPVVVGYVLLLLFNRSGPIGAWLFNWFGISVAYSWKGAAIASAIVALPFMVRAMRQSLEGVDSKLENAARTLGASKLRCFSTVTLPLALPGMALAVLLGFARALGEFGATITFVSNIPGQTQTLPLALYSQTQAAGRGDGATTLALIYLSVALLAMVASEILSKRRRPVRKVAL